MCMASVQKDQHSQPPTNHPSALAVRVRPGGVVRYRAPITPNGARRRLILVLGLLVVFILLGTATWLSVNAWSASQRATVTILPQYTVEARQIALNLVPTKPSMENQIQARILTTTTPAQTATVPATGTYQQPTRVAMGEILFLNLAPYPQDVPPGSVLTASNGIQVKTLAQAQIPAGNPPQQGMATVPARAIDPGAAGNIAAYALNNVQCCDTGTITGVVAENPRPFTGGQDAASYTVVQQDDITAASAPLILQQKQAGLAVLHSQIHPDEQLAGDITCTPSIQSDVPAGGRASQVQVSVKTTCRGEVYPRAEAQRKASALWSSQVLSAHGAAYRAGQIQIEAGKVTSTDVAKGTLTLTLPVRGVVFYQLDRTVLQRSLAQIAGKSPKEAQALLLRIAGVSRVTITGTNQSLPTDPTHITLTVSTPTLSTHA